MPDMIAARQELDLRPQLERLDRLMLRSGGLDPAALTFAFRPLWQLDAAAAAAIALQKAQATQIYAGLGLWPAAVTARLVEAQLVQDGTYRNAAAVFAERAAEAHAITDTLPVADLSATAFAPWVNEPRDPDGRCTTGGGRSAEPEDPDTSSPPPGAPGPHAPDGTPVELASSKGPARALARLLRALVAAVRSVRRWWPEEPDEPEPSLSNVDPELPKPSVELQTKKNKLAQSRDPRIRSNLADKWIMEDGKLNWPDNKGVDGPETALTLQPGQVVDKYEFIGGNYLSPSGTPFEARSLPYDQSRTPLHTFRVLKPFVVRSGRIAPWFDKVGGGLQFRTYQDIDTLVDEGYLHED